MERRSSGLLETLFARRREQGAATLGAFFGVMLVLIFLLSKNAVIAIGYLKRQ